jgi:hypothetical protein
VDEFGLGVNIEILKKTNRKGKRDQKPLIGVPSRVELFCIYFNFCFPSPMNVTFGKISAHQEAFQQDITQIRKGNCLAEPVTVAVDWSMSHDSADSMSPDPS